jgi:DHA2 family multidrug resistance protein-like MFS transporter
VNDPVFGVDAAAAYDSAYLYILAITCGVALLAAVLTARCFTGNPKGTVAHQ